MITIAVLDKIYPRPQVSTCIDVVTSHDWPSTCEYMGSMNTSVCPRSIRVNEYCILSLSMGRWLASVLAINAERTDLLPRVIYEVGTWVHLTDLERRGGWVADRYVTIERWEEFPKLITCRSRMNVGSRRVEGRYSRECDACWLSRVI